MSFRKVSLSATVDVRFYTHSDITDDVLAVTGQDPASNPFFDNGFKPAINSNYYHTDHQGSVRALTDDTGTIINEYSYGAYGNTETAVEAFKQPFRYTSREYDPDTGLMHYRARTYDLVAGRFLQEDPIGFGALLPGKSEPIDAASPRTNLAQNKFLSSVAGELNLYRYVGGNPTNYVDPSGLLIARTYTTLATNAQKGVIAIRIGMRRVSKVILRAYVKTDVRTGGNASAVAACAEGAAKGYAGVALDTKIDGDLPTLKKRDKFVRLICNGVGRFLAFSSSG